MGKQRLEVSSYSRRRFLQAAGVAGVAGVAGCSGNTGGGSDGESQASQSTAQASERTGGRSATQATERNGGQSTAVAVLSAGSLQNALSEGLEPAVDVPVQIESHGSATVARMIDEGQRDPDIVTVADVALFEKPLSPPWYSVFASNSVVLAYNPDTEGGKRLSDAGAENWYRPLLDGDVSIGRTDPDQDPLGYRAIFVLELASRYYADVSNLKEKVLKRDQIYPETALVSQFETGSIDAAIAYRNMAVERGYEFVDLPDQIDLSNPQYADDWYSSVSYTLPSGQDIRGGLISYGSTIRHPSDAALSVFDVLTTGSYLEAYGFIRREQFPTYEGDVPERVTRATTQSKDEQAIGNQSRLAGSAAELSPAVSDITILI